MDAMKKVIFIDNGVTGSIGVYDDNYSFFTKTPVIHTQDYTKHKKEITRVDTVYLKAILATELELNPNILVVLERPMVNPKRFTATESALRAMEATITVIETLELPYIFCDSKEWQKGILPSSGKRGTTSDVLKKESLDIGIRLFPKWKELILKHKDADGILGAYQFYKKENGILS